jgi:serine/threonine protein kinase
MAVPERLGRYRVTKVLAEGGMGQVLLGSTAAGMPVVLKRLLRDTPEAQRRFRDEGRMGRRLAFEEGFVETLDAFEDPEVGPVLVLEAIDGVTVEALRKVNPLTDGLVAQIGADVAKALRALHGLQRDDGGPLHAVHRDIGARNILVDVKGRTKVIDLGASFFDDDDRSAHSEAGHVIGTVRYIPPEVILGGPTSQVGDVWSLGLVLLELALGRVFWRGSIEDVATAVARRDPMLEPGVERLSARLRASLARLLVRDPAKRLTAGEAFDELSALAGRFGDMRLALQQAVLIARAEVDGGRLETEDEDVYIRLGGVEDDSTRRDAGGPGAMSPEEGLSAMVSAGMQAVRLEDIPTTVTPKARVSGPETDVDGTQRDAVVPSVTAPDAGSSVSSGVFASSPSSSPSSSSSSSSSPSPSSSSSPRPSEPEPASGLIVEAVSGAVAWPAAPRGQAEDQRTVPTEVVNRSPRAPVPAPASSSTTPVAEPPRSMTMSLVVGAGVGGAGLAAAWLLGWFG